MIGREDNPKSLNFFNASKNIPRLDVLSVNGINVYDVFKKGYISFNKISCKCIRGKIIMKDQPATDSYDIIRRPIITEKATLASENNTIAFEVSIKSTKKQIKGAIENLFNVKVESVNTLIVKGKVKRFRGKLGKRRDLKKAYVTLVEGNTIDVSTGL